MRIVAPADGLVVPTRTTGGGWWAGRIGRPVRVRPSKPHKTSWTGSKLNKRTSTFT